MQEKGPNITQIARDGSVTHWVAEIKAGNRDAAGELWRRYFDPLVRLARQRMRSGHPSTVDGEDVAISAFDSFCRAAEYGRFPDLADRDSLWRLFVQITVRKVISQRRRDMRQRRGGGRVFVESALDPRSQDDPQVMASIVGNEPAPQFLAMMSEEVERLLGLLGDQQLQQLTVGKMEGFTNAELAEKLNCSPRTIERRLRLIREKFRQELSDDSEQ